MEKITQNKLAVKIICVVLAIILWTYVSYQENPSMSKTVRNVPLAIAGEQALKENGFSVYSISEKSVDVKTTAKRLSLRKLTNKTISAVINVSSIKEAGEYVIPATVSSSIVSGASYYVKGNDIKVIIEPIESLSFDVSPKLSDKTDSDLLVRSVSLSKEKAKVYAPESIIKEISKITTEEILFENNSTTKTDGVRLVALGKDGSVIEGVTISPETVDVTHLFYDVKRIPVIITTTNGEEYQLPETYNVKIFGFGEEFNAVNEIYSEPISESVYKGSEEYTITLDIPKNIITTFGNQLIITP
ncbi:MAG: hypothetical protein IKA17_03065 [Clostridia bacterium]|nr:hypothetical protein [Clostridia bacterium]